jgi:hypothetical protein
MQTQKAADSGTGAGIGGLKQQDQSTMGGVRLSIFGGVKGETPTAATPTEVAELVGGGKLKSTTDDLRSLSEEKYSEEKKKLPAVTFSGIFSARKAEHLIKHSGLVVLDFDDLGETLPTVRAALAGDPSLTLLFVSPSGQGLKVVYRAAEPGALNAATHKAAWEHVAAHAARVTGLPISGAHGTPRIDQSGKDVSRLCFLSHDPDLIFRPEAPILPVGSIEPARSKGDMNLDLRAVPADPPGKATSPQELSREQKYVGGALDRECASVESASEGERNTTLTKAAFGMAGYHWTGFPWETIFNRLLAAGLAAGLTEQECRAAIAGGFAKGRLKPRQIPESSHQSPALAAHVGSVAGAVSAPAGDAQLPKLVTKTAREIQDTAYPPIRWIIEALLTEGLAVLAGKPKKGKSWLALLISLAVALGGEAIGKKAHQGDVLYLALEDGERRIKDRLNKLLAGERAPLNLHFLGATAGLGRDAVTQILRWLDDHPDCRLVIIDTLKKIMPSQKAGANQYDAEYAWMAVLQQAAITRHICILCVVHCRKMVSEDAFDAVSGTLGMTAACDGVLVLAPSASAKADAILHVTGREVRETELALSRKDGCNWRCEGDAEDFMNGETRNAVLSLFQEHTELAPMAVVKILGLPSTAVRKVLSDMVKDGTLQRNGRGKYRLPRQGGWTDAAQEDSRGVGSYEL